MEWVLVTKIISWLLFMCPWTLGFNDTVDEPLHAAKEECEMNKLKCNNDTDCYHRLFYVHSTCITGDRCKPQCKMAILRLYESEYGRKLLHSDLSCVNAIKGEIFECDLSPEAETVHCTLARQICHANLECHENLDIYETQCESKLLNMHKCPKPCVNYLVSVFKTVEGKKLSTCKCWPDEDALCQHRKSNVLDPCNESAIDVINKDKPAQEIDQQIILNVIEGDLGNKDQNSDYIVQQSNSCSALGNCGFIGLSLVFLVIVQIFY